MDFYFNRTDFQSCTGKKKDARHLYARFKELMTAIKNTQMVSEEFANFKGYVARPFNQGSKKYRDHMWLGFAHEKYKRPQDEVQFQVSINKDETLGIELFIDQAALETRQKVKTIIEKDKDTFLNLIRELSNCYIGYTGADEFQTECKRIKKADLIRILQKISERHIHFFIGRYLSKSEIDKFKKEIVLEIVHTWFQLRPLYDLMTLDKASSDNFKIPEILINNEGIIKNIERQFPSKDIDLDETEAKATERESKQIIYETNWLAQEKANKSHRKTVMLLAKYLKDHGIDKPMQSVIDAFAEKNDRIFIFEIKTIHTHNFIHQTRTAIGQLLGYEYFQIKSKLQNKGKDIRRAIVYSKKPAEEIIDFLMTYQFSVFWVEDGNLSGNSESMKVLKRFLSGA